MRLTRVAAGIPAATLAFAAAIVLAGCGGGETGTTANGTSSSQGATAPRHGFVRLSGSNGSGDSGSKAGSTGETNTMAGASPKSSSGASGPSTDVPQNAVPSSSSPKARGFERHADIACEEVKREAPSSPTVPSAPSRSRSPAAPSSATPSAAGGPSSAGGGSSYVMALAVVRRLESFESPPQIKPLYSRLIDALRRLVLLEATNGDSRSGSSLVKQSRLEAQRLAFDSGMPACAVPTPGSGAPSAP